MVLNYLSASKRWTDCLRPSYNILIDLCVSWVPKGLLLADAPGLLLRSLCLLPHPPLLLPLLLHASGKGPGECAQVSTHSESRRCQLQCVISICAETRYRCHICVLRRQTYRRTHIFVFSYCLNA